MTNEIKSISEQSDAAAQAIMENFDKKSTVHNAAFYGTIAGMLNDIPKAKRIKWIIQLRKMQKAKLIPEFDFV